MKKKVFIFLLLMTYFFIFFINISKVNARSSTFTNNQVNYYIGEFNQTNITYFNAKINNNLDLNLYDYQYYYVTNYGNEEFYVADVISGINNYESKNIFGIKLIKAYSNYRFKYSTEEIDLISQDIIEVLYLEQDILNVIYIVANDNLIDFVINNSKTIDIYGDGDVNQIILESMSFEKYFKSIVYSNDEIVNLTSEDLSIINNKMLNDENVLMSTFPYYANGAQTVVQGQYENYAASDGLIYQYSENLLSRNGHMYNVPTAVENVFVSDNPIVQIIPKQLFKTRGIYTYIGTEYGFYINTYKDIENDNYSNFIVFDIKSIKKAYATNGYVEIKPLFTGYANYINFYDCVMQFEGGSKLTLSNIGIKIGVKNSVEKNIGDVGYFPGDDNGYAISSYSVSAKGSGKNSNSEPNTGFLKSGARMLGLIPTYGFIYKTVALGGITILDSIYNEEYVTQYGQLGQLPDGTYTVTKSYINELDNTETMIREAGNLIKGIDGRLTSNTSGFIDKQNPLLYKCNCDHFYSVTYNFMQKNDNINWDSIITTIIDLEIVEDNTGRFLWWETGSLDYKDSVIGGWHESYNLKPTSIIRNININQVIFTEYAADSFQEFIFTPTLSGTFEIETFGSDFDTFLTLYLNGSEVDSDDDDGRYINNYGLRRCSLISYYFNQNVSYKIRIRGFGYKGGHTNFIIKKVGSSLLETQSDYNSYSTNSYNGNSIWQTFTPTRSDLYTIFTKNINNYVDTYLKIYDSNHNLLFFDNDSGVLYHAQIDIYLQQGKTYFIESRPFSTSSVHSSFSIIIQNQEVAYLNPLFLPYGYMKEFSLEKNVSDTVYFRMIPEVSSYYNIYTEYSSGYKDLMIFIFDSEMNLIASDDDSKGNLQPNLNIYLEQGKKYFIMIRQYVTAPSNSLSNGNLYFWKS